VTENSYSGVRNIAPHVFGNHIYDCKRIGARHCSIKIEDRALFKNQSNYWDRSVYTWDALRRRK